jgi:hypothetical protein
LFTYFQFIKPICLPTEASDDGDKYDGDLVHLIGWGSSSDVNGKATTILKRADIKVFSQRYVFPSK